MKTITLKDGTVFEIESYSFGNYGALILIIKSTMQEIFMKFTKESASEIVADIGKEETETFVDYTKIGYISNEGNNVRLALEKETA